MKETSFTVKTLGGNLPKKQSIKIKKSFKSSTKLLSLDFTNLVDKLTAETFYNFRTSELFNIWTLHLQSQLEPPINFKNLLKVFFTIAGLWWLLSLQFLHQWNLQIYFETLCYGEIEKTWLQNPSYINGVFLYLKRPLIDDLWCPLNTGLNRSQFGLQTNKLWVFTRCWFLLIRDTQSIKLVSRLLSRRQ